MMQEENQRKDANTQIRKGAKARRNEAFFEIRVGALFIAMQRTQKSLKETLNQALRAGLRGEAKSAKAKRSAVRARPLGLRPGIDPTSFNKLADNLEAEEFGAKQAALRRKR